jgi:hypothetical protein
MMMMGGMGGGASSAAASPYAYSSYPGASSGGPIYVQVTHNGQLVNGGGSSGG